MRRFDGDSASASSTSASAGSRITGRMPSRLRSDGSAKAATPAISPGTASHSDTPSFIARPQITAASSTISAKGALEGRHRSPANSAPSSSAAISAKPRPAATCCTSCSALRLPPARKSASIAETSPA